MNAIAIGVLALLTGMHAASVINAVAGGVPFTRVVTAALGAFSVVIGLALPATRPNWTIGIRTPWALADERSWARTHRLGGRLFVIVGIVLVVAAFVVPVAALLPLVLIGIVGAGITTVVYSWWTHDADPRAAYDTVHD